MSPKPNCSMIGLIILFVSASGCSPAGQPPAASAAKAVPVPKNKAAETIPAETMVDVLYLAT